MSTLLQSVNKSVTLFVIVFLSAPTLTFADLAIELTSPEPASIYPKCASITLKANPTTEGEAIKYVYFYRNKGQYIRRIKEEPWEYVDDKTIAINWQENGDDWTVHWQMGDIVITDAELYGPFEFECHVTDPTADFKFILGGNDIDFYLDAVSIIDMSATDVEQNPPTISGFDLYPAFPNPFNMQTIIRYNLPDVSHVLLEVYSMQGRKIKSLARGIEQPGMFTLIWDGTDQNGTPVSSGVYVYRLHAESTSSIYDQSRKMLLLK